ncbi:hypothetical protein SCP_0215000 [Sparassis crispa]|uniref:Uncharacterized protein n=1 Tax=Sparassis crispa TaxID=139825 RepID=A0A401GDR8_9APHY|nr:hypothetical protein SCP_0215000 [Sparassis crispa]GBE80281.1 hypothetical protein SCP_0215000 [Sparassis crispa]
MRARTFLSDDAGDREPQAEVEVEVSPQKHDGDALRWTRNHADRQKQAAYDPLYGSQQFRDGAGDREPQAEVEVEMSPRKHDGDALRWTRNHGDRQKQAAYDPLYGSQAVSSPHDGRMEGFWLWVSLPRSH